VLVRYSDKDIAMAQGYIQPRPETQSLWDELMVAKQAKDYVTVGKLSDQIRRLTIALAKEDRERGIIHDQNANYQIETP
jgi:hypothetical protein